MCEDNQGCIFRTRYSSFEHDKVIIPPEVRVEEFEGGHEEERQRPYYDSHPPVTPYLSLADEREGTTQGLE